MAGLSQERRAAKLARDTYMRRRWRAKRQGMVAAIKARAGCSDCGASDPRVLDFDHRPGTEKRGLVQALARGASWEVVLAEIAKCDVRCANCHRLLTRRLAAADRRARRGYHGARRRRPVDSMKRVTG